MKSVLMNKTNKMIVIILTIVIFGLIIVGVVFINKHNTIENERMVLSQKATAQWDEKERIEKDNTPCHEVHPYLTYVIVSGEHLCVRKDVLLKAEITPHSEVEENMYFVLSMVSYINFAVESAELEKTIE